MKPGARHVCAVLLAAWQARFAGANLASPEAYDVVLCDGRGTVQVQLVGSAGASFEINTADNSPILRVDDYAYAYEYGAKAQDPPGCSTYMYASVTDAGEVVACTQAVDSASDLGDHDYHADLRKIYTSLQAAGSRRLDADEAAAAAAVPVPVPIPTSLPSGGRTVMRNLVVLVRFADHASRCLPSASDIDKLFNSDTYTYDAAGVPTYPAISGSIKMLYLENSYDQFTFASTVTDWITVTDTESAAASGNSGLGTRVWTPLKEAVRLWAALPGNDLAEFDENGDGYIDAITFIHSGMAAEWGGTDCFGARYRSRVWSHKWAFFDEDFRADGVRVYSYNISPGAWGRTCTAAQAAAVAADGCAPAETLPIGHIGVIAHELGHYIGLPDMYDGAGGQGVGSYDLMANSWGHDGTQNNPPPFSAATKMSLGWIVPTPVTPAATGTALTVVHGKSRLYQVSPPSAADTNQEPSVYSSSYYQISAGFGDPANEYFLLEVSSNYGHHRAQPCQGLLLWHVDAGKGYVSSGLDSGETCFPYNLVHYTTALVQADGLYELERGSNRGDSGDCFNALRPRVGSTGHPNTLQYRGSVARTGLVISAVSDMGVDGGVTLTVSFAASADAADCSCAPGSTLAAWSNCSTTAATTTAAATATATVTSTASTAAATVPTTAAPQTTAAAATTTGSTTTLSSTTSTAASTTRAATATSAESTTPGPTTAGTGTATTQVAATTPAATTSAATTPAATTAAATTPAAPCSAQQHWVTCTFSVDNSVSAFSVDGASLWGSLPTNCRSNWRKPCTVTFADASFSQPQTVAFSAADAAVHTGSYCGATRSAGVALVCASTAPASAWNAVQSDLTWSTLSSTDALPGEAESAWYRGEQAGLPAVPTLSAFTCAACGLVRATYAKIWAAGCLRHGYFRKTVASTCQAAASTTTASAPAAATTPSACELQQAAGGHWVSCTLALDNSVAGLAVDGVDLLPSLSPACTSNWRRPCTVTFADTSFAGPQVLAFSGADADVHAESYCGTVKAAGAAVMCKSTSPLSAWNSVQSDFAWTSFSSSTPADTTGMFWTEAWPAASPFSVPTSSAFTCAQCDAEGRQWQKMWAAGCEQYAYFRRAVRSTC